MSLESMVHSSWDVQDEMPVGNTLQLHSLVSVSQPYLIIDDAPWHTPQLIRLKSSLRHVSAGEHASDPMPGSAPTQHRVAAGSTLDGLSCSANLMSHEKNVFLVHGMLALMTLTALLTSERR